MAAVTLAGCACSSDPVTGTAHATMASYPTELTACILDQGCTPLCRAMFHIGDAEIRRCELVAFDGRDPGAPPTQPLTPRDLQQIRGGTVRVTYVPNACKDGDSAWDDGYDGSGSATSWPSLACAAAYRDCPGASTGGGSPGGGAVAAVVSGRYITQVAVRPLRLTWRSVVGSAAWVTPPSTTPSQPIAARALAKVADELRGVIAAVRRLLLGLEIRDVDVGALWRATRVDLDGLRRSRLHRVRRRIDHGGLDRGATSCRQQHSKNDSIQHDRR